MRGSMILRGLDRSSMSPLSLRCPWSIWLGRSAGTTRFPVKQFWERLIGCYFDIDLSTIIIKHISTNQIISGGTPWPDRVWGLSQKSASRARVDPPGGDPSRIGPRDYRKRIAV